MNDINIISVFPEQSDPIEYILGGNYTPDNFVNDLYMAEFIFTNVKCTIQDSHLYNISQKKWYTFAPNEYRYRELADADILHFIAEKAIVLSQKLADVCLEIKKRITELSNEKGNKDDLDLDKLKDQLKNVGKLKNEINSFANASKAKNCAKIAESIKGVLHSSFDKNPDILITGSGIVDLRTGTLLPEHHAMGLRGTLRTDIKYNPNARAPKFIKFLMEITNQDKNLVNFIIVLMGYFICGNTSEQKYYFFFGPGGNGKGVLVQIMKKVFQEYSTTVKTDIFIESGRQNSGNEAGIELNKCVNKRLVTSSEGKKNGKLNQALLKNITGGDDISARGLYANPITFTPTFKVLIETNHLPDIYELDNGTWRRVVVVPFMRTFEGQERVPDLADKIFSEEKEGILSYIIDGAKEFYTNGVPNCDIVCEATAAYKNNSNPVGYFMSQVTSKATGQSIEASKLYELYNRFCYKIGIESLNNTAFGTILKEIGYSKLRKSSGLTYVDVVLTEFGQGLRRETKTEVDSIKGVDTTICNSSKVLDDFFKDSEVAND